MASPAPSVRQHLTATHLVGLTFFAVCGGDYGIEDAVGAAGPAWTLAGLLLVPWLWSLPIALMTAELGSMIPDVGGPVIWVERAFGPTVAHYNAIVHLVANFFDNALYPVMFVDYLAESYLALDLVGLPRYLLSAGMLLCVTLLNVAGVDAVASVSTLFTVLVISPFAALVFMGLPTLDPSAWFIGPAATLAAAAAGDGSGGFGNGSLGIEADGSGGSIGDGSGGGSGGGGGFGGSGFGIGGGSVRWGTFLSVLLWNTSGYDSVGALAAEVENPGRDFPRAMVASIVLISLVYVLPVGVGVSLDERSQLASWTDGTLARVAQEQVGGWLAQWISLGGALSAVGLLNTLLCAAARIVVSAGEIGVLPHALSRIDEASGAPVRATIALSLGLLLVLSLPFSQLVEFSMLFYGATTALEFLALVRLRSLEPHTPRPYRLPLTDGWALGLFCAPPLALCVLLIVVAERVSLLIFAATIALAAIAHCARGKMAAAAAPAPVARTGERRSGAGLLM